MCERHAVYTLAHILHTLVLLHTVSVNSGMRKHRA